MMPKAPTPPEKAVLPRASAHRPGISVRRLRQLFLHDGQRDFIGSRQVPHGDHLTREPASFSVAIARPVRVRRPGEASASEARAGPDGVAASQESVGFAAALAAHAAHFPQHPIEDPA